jgi:hypothetical protein
MERKKVFKLLVYNCFKQENHGSLSNNFQVPIQNTGILCDNYEKSVNPLMFAASKVAGQRAGTFNPNIQGGDT